MKLHTTNQYSFINRDNRVPHYQRLYQRNDGVRIWKKVSQDSGVKPWRELTFFSAFDTHVLGMHWPEILAKRELC